MTIRCAPAQFEYFGINFAACSSQPQDRLYCFTKGLKSWLLLVFWTGDNGAIAPARLFAEGVPPRHSSVDRNGTRIALMKRALDIALALHSQGRLSEAEIQYRRVLQREPHAVERAAGIGCTGLPARSC